MKNKVTCISINWWADDWKDLLVSTLIDKSTTEPVIAIHDNHKGENLGHGKGLDMMMKKVETEFVAVFDIDCHILLDGWDEILIEKFKIDPNLKLAIATDGGLLKPARPLAMFFRVKDIIKNDIEFRAINFNGAKFDVGIHAYFKMLSIFGDKSILKLPGIKTEYTDVLGNEYTLDGKRFVYHNWYGTRWFGKNGERKHEQIDGVKFEDFAKKKINLFNQVN